MSKETEQPAEQVFENPYSGSGSATYLFVGGFCLVAFAILGFIAAIGARGGQMSLHLTTTLPIIIATGLFARGFSRRNTPSRVVLDSDGMEVVTDRDSRRYHWSEIGSATTANVLNSGKTCLRVTDTAGKTIVRVDESFPEYDRLTKLVESYVDSKPDDDSIRILSRKAKRAGIVTFLFGCLLTTAVVFIALQTYNEQRARALLADKGVVGEGEIVRRFTAPNGVTKRIEYRVAGSDVRNVEVHPVFWEALEGAETVPVVYVPDEPDISRLGIGEVNDDDFLKTPKGGYLLSAIAGVLALFMLGYSPFAWMGYDLVFDDKQPGWRITRYGRVVWESKKARLTSTNNSSP